MPSKKKSAAKSSQVTAKELLLRWTQIASELKELEEKRKQLSQEHDDITQQLVSMEFTVEESATDENEETDDTVEEQEVKPKGKGKSSKAAKATKATKGKNTKAAKGKTTKAVKGKTTKAKTTKGKKAVKKPVMIATESTGSDTDSDTDSDSD